MSEPADLRVCRDADALRDTALEEVLSLADEALTRRGAFSLALAGGSTPRALYAALAASHRDFSRWTLLFGDERCVPPGHPDSNYGMVRDAWLAATQCPPAKVHRMRGEDPPEEAAAAYEHELRTALGEAARLDVALLGLGADGHTASLFPGSPALEEHERLVVATDAPAPLGRRLTLTIPALERARSVLFLVQGSTKARALRDTLEPPPGPLTPACRVARSASRVLWLVDRAAAGELRDR